MARACAAQTKSTFLKLAGPQLVQMFIGDGAKLVRDAFALAKEKAPAIIFIDELDAIGERWRENLREEWLADIGAERDGGRSVVGDQLFTCVRQPLGRVMGCAVDARQVSLIVIDVASSWEWLC